MVNNTGKLAYDRLNWTLKIGLSYTYDTCLICMGLGPSITSVICKFACTIQYNKNANLSRSVSFEIFKVQNVYLKDLHILEYIIFLQ